MTIDELDTHESAVLQLMLRREQTYADLAAVLQVSQNAVRDRVLSGLDRLGADGGLDPEDRGAVADFLLGQDTAGAAEAPHLLGVDQRLHDWALGVCVSLADISTAPLERLHGQRPGDADEPEPQPEPDPQSIEAPPPVSLRGGAILIAVVVVAIALVVWRLAAGGGDDAKAPVKAAATAAGSASPSPTATATASYVPFAQLRLKSTSGGDANGAVVFYAANDGSQQVGFQVGGRKLPTSNTGAYGIWLVEKDGSDHLLGLAGGIKKGQFVVGGPSQADASKFASWLNGAKAMIVTREASSAKPSRPGATVLSGDLSTARAVATATPTATAAP